MTDTKVNDTQKDTVPNTPEGAAQVENDSSKDAHWDDDHRTLEEKEKASGNAPTPKPVGNAPDAGMTPEESDKKLKA